MFEQIWQLKKINFGYKLYMYVELETYLSSM